MNIAVKILKDSNKASEEVERRKVLKWFFYSMAVGMNCVTRPRGVRFCFRNDEGISCLSLYRLLCYKQWFRSTGPGYTAIASSIVNSCPM